MGMPCWVGRMGVLVFFVAHQVFHGDSPHTRQGVGAVALPAELRGGVLLGRARVGGFAVEAEARRLVADALHGYLGATSA